MLNLPVKDPEKKAFIEKTLTNIISRINVAKSKDNVLHNLRCMLHSSRILSKKEKNILYNYVFELLVTSSNITTIKKELELSCEKYNSSKAEDKWPLFLFDFYL